MHRWCKARDLSPAVVEAMAEVVGGVMLWAMARLGEEFGPVRMNGEEGLGGCRKEEGGGVCAT